MGGSKFHQQRARTKSGESLKYITRNAACKRLGVSLKMFRKLCIIKGIHPRNPKTQLQGRDKTYYFVKDIKFMKHEPLLGVLQSRKTFLKKETKLKARKQLGSLERMQVYRPKTSLDHIVKERYPTFTDALNDLDDCLSLISLFALMDSSPSVRAGHIKSSATLLREFQLYVAQSGSLRRVFVSVKGIYYQAEIMGTTVTWLSPLNYINRREKEVDFNVMINFLEFYECMLRFINYRLYQSLGLVYPPTIDHEALGNGQLLGALITQAQDKSAVATNNINSNNKGGKGKQQQQPAKLSKENQLKQKKLDKLSQTLIGQASDNTEEQVETNDIELNEDGMSRDFDGLETVVAGEDEEGQVGKMTDPDQLFKGLKFFLNRETPTAVLEFVITSFGGKVSWDNGPYPVDDPTITHHVIDRSHVKGVVVDQLQREYVQPQWVFDCINSRLLLNCQEYGIGIVPPPHLSPFVEYDEESYIPARKAVLDQLISQAGFDQAKVKIDQQDLFNGNSFEDELNDEDGSDDDDDSSNKNKKKNNKNNKNNKKNTTNKKVDENGEDVSDEEQDKLDEEDLAQLEQKYMKDIRAETGNNNTSSTKTPTQDNATMSNRQKKKQAQQDQQTQPSSEGFIEFDSKTESTAKKQREKKKKSKEEEELRLAEMMINKKDKSLYHAVKLQNQRRVGEKNRLEKKKAKLDSGMDVDGIYKDKTLAKKQQMDLEKERQLKIAEKQLKPRKNKSTTTPTTTTTTTTSTTSTPKQTTTNDKVLKKQTTKTK